MPNFIHLMVIKYGIVDTEYNREYQNTSGWLPGDVPELPGL